MTIRQWWKVFCCWLGGVDLVREEQIPLQWQSAVDRESDALKLCASLQELNGLLTDENARLSRMNSAYFDGLDKLQAQRDEWREMFHTQARQHECAQSMLQEALANADDMLRRCVDLVNVYRDEKGEPKLQRPELAKGVENVGGKVYGDAMRALAEQATPLVSAAELRATA